MQGLACLSRIKRRKFTDAFKVNSLFGEIISMPLWVNGVAIDGKEAVIQRGWLAKMRRLLSDSLP